MLAAFIVTLFLLAALVVFTLRRELTRGRELTREVDRQNRLRESRENVLLDRLAHANDKPWAEPPIDEVAAEEDEEEQDEMAWDLSHVDDDVLVPAAGGF